MEAAAREQALLHDDVPLAISRRAMAGGTGGMGGDGRRRSVKLDDLTGPTCERCGAEIPEFGPSGRRKRVEARHCSKRCAALSYQALQSAAILESKADRPACAFCRGPVAASRDRRAIYCSVECARAANAFPRYPVACERCGRDFLAMNPGQRSCSTRCRDEAVLRKHYPRACIQCGAEYRPKSGRSKYCTIRCAAEHREATRRLEATRKITCVGCGKDFLATAVQTFCSGRCRTRVWAQRKRVAVTPTVTLKLS